LGKGKFAQGTTDGNGKRMLYLKPSVYTLVFTSTGFYPETLLNVDITDTLVDTHRVAVYLSPLPATGLDVLPDSLVTFRHIHDLDPAILSVLLNPYPATVKKSVNKLLSSFL